MMENCFEINENLLTALDEYHEKTMLMEKHVIEKIPCSFNLEQKINDDLIFNVPIYDMGSRKYAAFCSLLEALIKKDKDVKGNGKFFSHVNIGSDFDFFMLFYLFRLCGSGINYNPIKSNNSINDILGTHGFGNFWVVDSLLEGKYTWKDWKQDLVNLDKPFTNNKGYLLPQFSFPGMSNGHLKKFILEYSEDLVLNIFNKVNNTKLDIYQVTDFGNNILKNLSFKKQNFVLTAFAADISEYYPNMVNPKGMVYAGTNATNCIKAIFPKKNKKVKEFDYINEVLQFQSKRYGLNPIDCEDSRNCDPVRYFKEYQSKEHIEKNKGITYKNNSILKSLIGEEKYYAFAQNL